MAPNSLFSAGSDPQKRRVKRLQGLGGSQPPRMQKSMSRQRSRSAPSPKTLQKRQQRSARRQRFQQTEQLSAPSKREVSSRLLLVWMVLIAGSLGLILNLVRLQVVQGSMLAQRAKAQQQFAPPVLIPRRPIIDRQGNIVAIDRPVYTLYAHPMMFTEPVEEVAEQLAPVLERSESELEKQLKSSESGLRIADFVAQELGDRIAGMGIDGLELVQKSTRLYPQQDLLATILGYVDVDNAAQAGIEYSQKQLLERTLPGHQGEKNHGSVIIEQKPDEFLPMDDLSLQLTVDSRLQRSARSALKAQLQQYNAKRGAVIVMDARDGSLLALVSEPSYDPNQYYNFDLERFKNWTLTDIYEPGSTFKPITMAIALESGAVQPESGFYDEGTIYVDGWPISNADGGGSGYLSLSQIIQYSSNVGTVHVVQQMQPSVFYSWLERLGLGQAVATDLPFVTSSQIKPQEEFVASPANAATAGFGQGFALTPLQLVQLHGTLANGGKLVTPHVVRGLFNSQDQPYWQPQLSPPRQIFSRKTTQAVLSMMEQVVQAGTGTAAQIPGYRIAGKTGTAQKASGGGYSDYAKVVSFVGIIPADAPRYVVLAVVDEPVGGSGGIVAAPIVKAVMESLIAIEGIPPSQETQPEPLPQEPRN